MKRHLSLSAIAAALLFVAALPNARAATSTATFQVSLTVQPTCAAIASALNFGSTGALTAAVNGQTTLSVTCTNTTAYSVALDGGNVSGSTVTSRLMAGTTAGNTSTTVGFQLYQDAAHNSVWGNTTGTNTVSGTGNGAAQSITVYGSVPIQTTPQPDTYQTLVTATVTF